MSAAYLRILGATQQEAATGVGRSERTIQLWEAEASWLDARTEAQTRWLADATDLARHSILKALCTGDANTGRWLLERVVPELAPPKTKHEVTGENGGPIAHSVTVRFVKPAA